MMKAFSFLTILESLSKKLSILRTKMHSDNLRVDYESITSQLRVSRPFSRTSFADISRRASHFAAILTILFTVGVGNVWGEIVLFDVDFSDEPTETISTENSNSTFIQKTYDGYQMAMGVKKGKYVKIVDDGLEFSENNYDSYTCLAIPLTLTANNEVTVAITLAKKGKIKYGWRTGVLPETPSAPEATTYKTEGTTNTITYTPTTAGTYVLYLGRSGSSSGKVIKSIKITTPTPCDGISPSLTYSKTTLQVGEQLDPIFNPDGSTGAVTYESNNTAAVTVDTNGKITAVGVGMATIKASVAAANGKCAGEATVNILVLGTTGQHTLTWNLNVVAGSSESNVTTTDIGTASKQSSSIYLTDLTNLTGVGVNRTSSGKNNNTGKIETPAAYDESKYVSMTFSVADGYGFVPSSVSIKTVAVTTTKDLKFEISDANGSYSVTKTGLSTNATAEANTLDFSSCNVTFTGTVTVKIYVYGANDTYRLSTPLTIDGTVEEVETPVTTTITLSSQGGSGGTASVTATKGEAMPEIDIPTRTGYNFQGYFTANGGSGTKYYNANGTSAKNWDKEDATFTLIAYWTAKTTNVTLDANGGSGGSNNVMATYGSAMTTITPATLAGYALTGYFDAASGGTKYYKADGTSNKNWDKEAATTTLYAQWECTAPTDVKISGEYVHFPGETLTLTVSGGNIANNATYTWKKGDQVIAEQTTATLTINSCEITDAGNYTCTISNGDGCEATADFTVKMYSLRGLIDWSTDCSFTKVNATTATYSMELAGSSSYEFKIFDGSVYYGNEGANPTMTSANCTNWTMQENMGNNVTLQTTASGTYTFTLDYSDASNLKISVTYPAKRIVYLEPGVWESNNPKFVVHAWYGSTVQDILMTKIDDCAGRNIYQAEIDANNEQVIFIRVNPAGLNLSNPWNNEWNRTKDLTLISENQFTITNWGGTGEWNNSTEKSNGEWTSFTPNYTVTFEANGHGAAPEAQCVAKNGKATTPTEPTETGYTFGGWYKEAGCSNAWDFANDVVTSDITLYAKWTVNRYTVTWNPAGGNWGGNTNNIVETYEYGAKINAPEKPSRTGYEFAEWDPTYDANATTMPANNVTYTAQWREIAQTYNIIYNLGPEGEGWEDGYTPAPTYTAGVEYTLPTSDNLNNVNHGTFQGWFESADFQGNEVTTIPDDATGDKTYYAKWVYDIQFFEVVDEETDVVNKEFANPLEGSYPTTYTYGVGITLPALPAKDGYTAAGWYSQWCVYNEQTGWVDACKYTALDNKAYGDVNFAVKYTPNTYTVTFNTNEGTINAGEINSYTFGVGATLPIDVTKENYTFLGWFDNEGLTGTAVTTISTTTTGNKTYWAKWEEDTPVTPPTQGDCWNISDDAFKSLLGSITANQTVNGLNIVATSEKNVEVEANEQEFDGIEFTHRLKLNGTGADNSRHLKFAVTGACTIDVYLMSGKSTEERTLKVAIGSFGSKEGTELVAGATIAKQTYGYKGGATDIYMYSAGSGINIYQICVTYPATPTPTPDNCGISECGNATLTYTINASTSTTNTADNLLSSATASNTAALEVNDNAVFSNITASEDGKAAAAANECFNPAPVMSSKISMPGERNSYNADNYIQFTFTVKSGYAFTPCDIQFVVQPVNSNANFRWAITDGTTEYGSGTATNVPLGLDNGATVLTGITSPAKMIAGTYYIRLYPYDDNFKDYADSYSNNSFRISNDVILKGTVEADNTPRYTVTFNANGHGTAPAAQTVTSGEKATEPTAPTATGYNFGGWYKEAGCTNAYDFNTEVTSDITLYAKWTAKQYNITYKDKDNSTFSGTHGANYPTKHTYGTATTLVEPTKDGYTFEGWFTTSACTGDAVTSLGATAYTADITLYAKWEVVDDCAAETIYSFSTSDEFTNGWDLVKTRDDYECAVKTSAYNGIAPNDGGMLGVGIVNESGSVTITSKESFTNISKITLKLASTDSNNPTFAVYVINGNTDIKIFQTTPKNANVVEAKSNKDWGTHSASVSNLSGKIKIVFNSSSSGKYATIDDLIICGTSAQTYNVTYKANGGTGDDVTSKVAVVGACPNSFTAPTGTTFKGWNTAADGTGTAYAVGEEVQSDLTLYAQWDVAYTVTYHANGATSGTAPKDNNKYFSGDQVSILGNISNMTKTNHSFVGWNTQADGSGTAYTAGSKMTMPAANVTLYAVWNNEKCGENYVTWTLPTNNGAFTSFSTTQNGLTATAEPTNSDVTVASDAKEDLTTKLIPTAETSYLEFKFTVPDNKQFTPCELTLPVQPITSACNFTITVTDGTNTLTRTFTNCAHGSITTLTMNNTSTIAFTGDVSIKIYSTGTTHGYRLGSPLSIFGTVQDVQNPCTTPVLPTLSATTVCAGEDVSWNAAITNELADGETVEYKWVKSPNTSTILATTAQYQIANATEAATGTYIVSATVSAEGKNRTIAHTQVRLTVTPTTATPTITADKDKVYAGNSVTLTASTTSTGVTYQWYTCDDAEGTNATEIEGATNSAYTIASAGDAGTHYYKVRVSGDGTHSCGDAEKMYSLVVSEASGECHNMVIFDGSTDDTCPADGTTGSSDNGATWTTKGTADSKASRNFTYGSKTYTLGWKFVGGNTQSDKRYITFTIPADYTANLFMAAYTTSTSRSLFIAKTATGTLDKSIAYITFAETYTLGTASATLEAGTYYVCATDALYLTELSIEVCASGSCTDPDVTATVDNATICEGGNESTVTFTATGAADDAIFQWHKKNGSNWEPISEATFDNTYTISPVTTDHAGQYRVVATKGCNRISNELTLNVLTAPTFGNITTTRSVMQTTSLVIDDVEATGATSYAWYKSADNAFDNADTQIGTAKALTINSVTEAVGDNAFYLFCVATNSCGSIPSSAIAVNVTALVEEECAIKGNEGSADFFTFVNTGCGNKEIESKKVWSTNSRNKYLTYTTIEGKYFETAKVQIAHSESKKAAYAYSTDGGTNWTYVEIPELSASLATYTITFPANVNAFRIGRNFTASDGEKGSTSGTFYLYEACFTYTNACTATTLTPSIASPTYTMGGDADFTEPTFTLKAGETPLTPDNGAITYSSSNTAIATVESDGNVHFEGMTGSVTITATYAGGTIGGTEYCECTGSYTITVSCDGEEAPIIVAANGTNMSECNASITLEVKKQDKTTDFESGSYQWYRNGVAIDGATAKAYTATQSGTYTVVHYGKCDQWSTNKAVITNDNSEPSVERLAPFQYYHVDKTYSDQMKDRHLFAVKSYGRLDNGKRYQLSATRNGSPWDISTSTSFFVITSADNAVDTIMLDLNQMKGKFSEGDNIVITCNPVNSCNALSTISNSITIKVIDQTPTLALICSGADGEGTRDTKTLVVGGDFLTGYNPADLCQQTENRAFDATKEWGFYTVLKENYIVVPVNGYATFNKLNYEPFDILLLTDYPKTGHSEAAQKIIDDMSDLCDYRPLLSFKTHFQSTNFVTETGEFKYNKWTKKGFTTAPVVPAQPALYADIVCYAHPMFDAISDVTASEDFYHNADDHDQLVYKILSQAGHEGSKGMQGFELADAANFVTIGLIHNDASAAEVTHDNHEHVKWTSGANDRQLVAIAERQANIEARMILFSINCGAQSMQTEGGRQVILQCLKYLYDPEVTDPELIVPADCHLTFDNKTGDGKWSTAGNWAPGYKVCPTANSDVRIAAPCTVDIADAEALSVQIVEGGSLTIGQGAALNVTGPIIRFDKETNTSSPTESEDIFIGSVEAGNGTLIFNNNAGTTKATVQMYSIADADTDTYSAAKSTWQYIGTPHSDVQNAVTNYYNSWLYQYGTESQSWEVIPNGGPLVPFKGYCITHPETPHTYTMTGTLVTTMSQSIDIPAGKYVVVANSWTAPIQVANFADADLENITDKTVYLFNTGSDPEGNEKEDEFFDATTSAECYAPGTYVAMPIHSAPYIGCATIPSMQGFYVVGGSSDGQLHLDYDQLVRPKATQSIVGTQMHAPKRIAAQDDEPLVLKMIARGSKYDDNLFVLERADFTRAYDSGWDGEEWGGNDAAPMLYIVNENNVDETVSAIPNMEGTVISFRAGEDSEYTFQFDFDDMAEALYLLDTDTKIYTRILKGNTYTFQCADKKPHNRFILTRKAPQIATGTEHINTGENAKAVKFIKDDKIFIFVNGTLYDATGKMVIR